MEKAYKFRLYPNKEQQILLAKTFGCTRFVYNYYLDKRITAYKTDKTTLSAYDCINDLKHLKDEYVWLKDCDSVSYQQTLRNQDIANQRADFLHKLSTRFIKEYDIICLEDLNVSGILKNHKLARSVSDVSWSQFTTMLQYKANWYGKDIIKIDRFFASSQLCNVCGYKNTETKDLSVRSWVCPVCGTSHDRDVNASINILNEGLKQIV